MTRLVAALARAALSCAIPSEVRDSSMFNAALAAQEVSEALREAIENDAN